MTRQDLRSLGLVGILCIVSNVMHSGQIRRDVNILAGVDITVFRGLEICSNVNSTLSLS